MVAVLDPSRGFRTGECQVAFDDLRPVLRLLNIFNRPTVGLRQGLLSIGSFKV